jgi:hypothetical protein
MGDPKENRRLKERTRAARAKEVVYKKRKSRAYREGKRVSEDEKEELNSCLF